jgi:RHS repeat-associated protein
MMVTNSYIQSKTDIQNFYGYSTYLSLMEHLKELHPIEVQAFVLDELHIYGSSRLGILKVNMNLVEFDAEQNITFEAEVSTEYMHRDLGNKRYELSNHLGNVLVTITDKKVYVEDAGDVAYFEPEITSISDYYPFGSVIATRAFASKEYRYGFNGKELDSENNSGAYDFGARVLDARLGRWLAVDFLRRKYVSLSPYNFAANNPIQYIDPDGKIIVLHYQVKDEKTGKMVDKSINYTPGVKPTVANEFLQQVHEAVSYTMQADPENSLYKDLHNSKNVTNIKDLRTTNDNVDKSNGNQTAPTFEGTQNNITGEVTSITNSEATIYWDPTLAGKTTNGAGQSPSTILFHESLHAKDIINVNTPEDYKKYVKDNQKDKKYGAYSDKRHSELIPGPETDYIKKVNEYEAKIANTKNMDKSDGLTYLPQVQGTRTSHSGSNYPVSSVNTITPADHTKVSGTSSVNVNPIEVIQNQIDKQQDNLAPKPVR